MNIEDKVILVTGANRGLGRALVEGALAAGARRVYAGARDPNALSALRGHGERVRPLRIDITEQDSLTRAAADAPDVELLFNNAGLLASTSFLESEPEQIQREFTTNFFGLVSVTTAFLPALQRAASQREAAIVNVLSVASLANVPQLGAYSASKAAAFSFTQALRAELSPKNIRVHAVFPGPIDTDMVRHMPMQKTSPEEVARAILEGVRSGVEDISPDAMARDVLAIWQRDPKQLERQFATMMG